MPAQRRAPLIFLWLGARHIAALGDHRRDDGTPDRRYRHRHHNPCRRDAGQDGRRPPRPCRRLPLPAVAGLLRWSRDQAHSCKGEHRDRKGQRDQVGWPERHQPRAAIQRPEKTASSRSIPATAQSTLPSRRPLQPTISSAAWPEAGRRGSPASCLSVANPFAPSGDTAGGPHQIFFISRSQPSTTEVSGR